MKLGYLDLGDGAGISASLEDEVLTLSGSLDAGGLADAFGPRAQLASMRSGLILPLYAEEDDRFGMTELDGLYELGQVGSEYSPGMPWAMTLRRLATGSVEGEVSSVGKMLPVVSPVVFPATSVRVGVPGDVAAQGPTVNADETVDLDEGRVRTVLHSSLVQAWTAFTCSPGEWLAGSPRIEIQLAGAWWPIHGQPPAGVPVRVHNGRVGFRLPTGGSTAAALRINAAGAVDRTYGVTISDSGGFQGPVAAAGVEVVRADSEMVWVRWVQKRQDWGATRQLSGLSSDLVVRRGMSGLTLSMSISSRISIAASNNGAQHDSPATTTVGAKAGDLYFVGQQSCSVSGTTSTLIDSLPLVRIESGGTYRTRAWAAPTIWVLR